MQVSRTLSRPGDIYIDSVKYIEIFADIYHDEMIDKNRDVPVRKTFFVLHF